MKKISFVFILVAHIQSMAFTDVCELREMPINQVESFSKAEVEKYKQNLERECDLRKKYTNLKENLANFDVTPNEVMAYKALRYVDKSFFDRAISDNTPVSQIYQTHKSYYAIPISERVLDQTGIYTEVWDNWFTGIKQLEPETNKILNGDKITIDMLKRVHKGFYTSKNQEIGDFTNIPYPGIFKPAVASSAAWWTFKTEDERLKTTDTVSKINDYYRKLNLLPSQTESKLPDELNGPISVDGNSMHSGDNRVNALLIRNIFKFANQLIDQARLDQHMVYQGRLFTPGQLAYLVQQFYVQVHPFSEGNGRTSRFLQELILGLFGMPHGNSGALMSIDVLTQTEEYYDIAINKNIELINQVNMCAQVTYPVLVKNNHKPIKAIDSANIEYRCRILQ